MGRGRGAGLSQLERWFQGQVVGPHEARKMGAERREAQSERHILPSRSLKPGERVAVYAEMYFVRLHDVMADEYRATRELCGAEEFERLVRAYLRAHPSRHWSLDPLGWRLPEFLEGKFRIARKALLRDVATLECSIARVFGAPQSRVMTSEEMRGVAGERFAEARVRWIDALELHELDHRANAVVKAVLRGEKLPSLGRKRTRTVVWRKEWEVWRMDLEEMEFAVLSGLKAGETVGAAIAKAAEGFEGTGEEMQARVSAAFSEWIAEGLISAVEVG